MKILGISPLDKDATASLVEDGQVLFAAAEERYSRRKQHAGFPRQAIESALRRTGTRPEEVDVVAYPFFDWDREVELIEKGLRVEDQLRSQFDPARLNGSLRTAMQRVPDRTEEIHGLRHPNQRMEKGKLKELVYQLAGTSSLMTKMYGRRASRNWAKRAGEEHKKWSQELESSLREMGFGGKLKRFEHHLSHAANSYYASGFDRALIVTLDGYGSGLAGSISVGEEGKIKRLHDLVFPFSLGSYYESVTSSLGFNPNRHGGKIVGLAAYGDPSVLSDVVLERFDTSSPGGFGIVDNLNIFFSRHLASHFPMVDVAAAYQHVLEVVSCSYIKHWLDETGCDAVVLSGGVTANVKMNQRIFEIDGVRRIFVYPNMGDGGCGTGIALHLSQTGEANKPIDSVYYGPSYTDEEIQKELDAAGLSYEAPANLAGEVARRVHGGEVVARFDGRMEYGPRALGNRSILYHAREPEVNQWLNQRLGRTEFMPFAPVTLFEERHKCYLGVEGADHTAEFMTITFDCTDSMKETCPAAVHVDGTARPQLIKRETNPGYYDIVKEYEKLSGLPSLINTSFNMHEEPIVCSPQQAVRAFLKGHLDGLAIGSFYVENPSKGTDGVEPPPGKSAS